MYKHLYDNFSHWQKLGGLWFYADPHFGDEEMKYLRPNYIGDDEQVARINEKVGKNDTIVFLGDIGDLSYLSKIRGYKILIKGNYDAGATKYLNSYEPVKEYKTTDEATEAFRRKEISFYTVSGQKIIGFRSLNLFDEVYEGPLLINPKILLSHEPIDYPYAFNIHGHVHSGINVVGSQHFNCCAELINYTPIPLKYFVNSGFLKNIPDIHRETIDKASSKI